MLRLYPRLTGLALALLVIAGVLGISEVQYGDIVVFLFTAAIFSYVGFGQWRGGEIRAVVGGIGLVHLLIWGGSAGALFLFGFSDDPSFKDYLVRMELALVSVLCARVLPCEDDPTPPASS